MRSQHSLRPKGVVIAAALGDLPDCEHVHTTEKDGLHQTLTLESYIINPEPKHLQGSHEVSVCSCGDITS